MAVRKQINPNDGIYFITITCYKWLNLFSNTNSYDIVYRWFDYLKSKGHFVNAYVIMPNHLHVLLSFRCAHTSINRIIGNAKRLMAYQIIDRLTKRGSKSVIKILQSGVTESEREKGKKHQVFQASFDWKECFTDKFIYQKLDYIHKNPNSGKWSLSNDLANYDHSSAQFYLNGKQGLYPVTNVEEMKDIDLTNPL